jgi:hypothetical protein
MSFINIKLHVQNLFLLEASFWLRKGKKKKKKKAVFNHESFSLLLCWPDIKYSKEKKNGVTSITQTLLMVKYWIYWSIAILRTTIPLHFLRQFKQQGLNWNGTHDFLSSFFFLTEPSSSKSW